MELTSHKAYPSVMPSGWLLWLWGTRGSLQEGPVTGHIIAFNSSDACRLISNR